MGVIFVTASNLFAIFPAQLVRKSIDLIKDHLNELVQAKNNQTLTESLTNSLGSSILYFTLLVIAFAIIRGLFMYFMRQTIIVMSRKIEYDLKNEVFTHYQLLDQTFYRNHRIGDLMSRISEDVSRVRMYVGPALMYAINLLVTIILVLIVMFTVSCSGLVKMYSGLLGLNDATPNPAVAPAVVGNVNELPLEINTCLCDWFKFNPDK